MMTIYTWGDGQILWIVFNALATIFGNGVLTNAAYAIVLLVGTYHLLKHGIEHNLFTLMAKLVVIMSAFFAFYQVRENVTIQDLGTGNVYTVSNVPFIPALWGDLFTHIEYDLTNIFDNAYMNADSVPSAATYSQSGYAFWQTLYADLPKLKQIADSMPYLTFTYDNFVQNCVLPSVVQGYITINDINTEPIPQAFQNVNQALSTQYMTTNNVVQTDTCPNVYNVLFGSSGYFTNFANSNVAQIIQGTMFPSYSVGQISNLTSQASQVLDYFTGVSADINTLAEDSLATSMFADSLLSTSAQSANLAPYISTMTLIKQIQERSTIAELGKRWIPVIHQIVEVMFYGVMPIFALMVLTPMAGKVLLSIIEFGLWLSFWGPLFAILNMLVNIYSQSSFQIYSGSATYQLSAYMIAGLVHGANDISSLAASLSWAVPGIALALATGSTYALAQIPGAIQGIVSGIGSGMATQMTNPDTLMRNSVTETAQLANFTGTSMWNRSVMKEMFSSITDSSALGVANNVGNYLGANAMGGAPAVMTASATQEAGAVGSGIGALNAVPGLSNYGNLQKHKSEEQTAETQSKLDTMKNTLTHLGYISPDSKSPYVDMGNTFGSYEGLTETYGTLTQGNVYQHLETYFEQHNMSPLKWIPSLATAKPVEIERHGKILNLNLDPQGKVIYGNSKGIVGKSFTFTDAMGGKHTGTIFGLETKVYGQGGTAYEEIKGVGTFDGQTGQMDVFMKDGKVFKVDFNNRAKVDSESSFKRGTSTSIVDKLEVDMGNILKNPEALFLALADHELNPQAAQEILQELREHPSMREQLAMGAYKYISQFMTEQTFSTSAASKGLTVQKSYGVHKQLQHGAKGDLNTDAALKGKAVLYDNLSNNASAGVNIAGTGDTVKNKTGIKGSITAEGQVQGKVGVYDGENTTQNSSISYSSTTTYTNSSGVQSTQNLVMDRIMDVINNPNTYASVKNLEDAMQSLLPANSRANFTNVNNAPSGRNGEKPVAHAGSPRQHYASPSYHYRNPGTTHRVASPQGSGPENIKRQLYKGMQYVKHHANPTYVGEYPVQQIIKDAKKGIHHLEGMMPGAVQKGAKRIISNIQQGLGKGPYIFP